MERNSPNFSLLNKTGALGNNPLRMEIEKCELFIHMMEVDSRVSQEIENVSFGGSSMLFPLRHVTMEQHRIAANMRDISMTNILVGENELPRRLFLVFVRHDAVNRDLSLDPFNYRDFGMNRIGLRVGGVERPFPIMDCDFTNGKVKKPLLALLEAASYLMTEQDMGFDSFTYNGRNCIFGFDLTTSHAPPGMCFKPAELQTIEVVAQLRAAQAFAIELIIYAEYDAEMELQSNRKVIMHNNA